MGRGCSEPFLPILIWIFSPSPADLPDPGIERRSPALQVDSLPTELPGKSKLHVNHKSKTYSRRTNTQKIVVIVCCSVVSDSVIPWTAAHQASLSFTISQNLLKLTSIESVDAIQSSHLLLSPSPLAFNLSQHQGLF